MKKSGKKQVVSLKKKLEHSIVSVIVVSQDDGTLVKKTIRHITTLLRRYPHFEIVVVDNGSTEKTLNQLRAFQQTHSHMRLLVLSKNTSVEIALTAGLENSIGDHVILFNQQTDPPRLIPPMIEALTTGSDVVLARFPVEDYVLRSSLDHAIIKTIQRYYHRDLFSYLNYFTGLNRRVVNALTKIKRKRKDFSYLNNFVGFRRKNLKYQPNLDLINAFPKVSALHILHKRAVSSLANSEKPLRFALVIASVASLLNFLFLLYVLGVSLIKHNLAEGWLTTSVMIGTMFLLLFLVLAILSEYILRIWDETHQEPLYFISEEADAKTPSPKDKLNIV